MRLTLLDFASLFSLTALLVSAVPGVGAAEAFRDLAITAVDDYEQWQDARAQKDSTDASAFRLLPGFVIERVRSAAEGEDSWISMRFDPQGRIIVAREKKGLLRLTLTPGRNAVSKVEVVNDTLPEVRGLVFAQEALFANSNNHNQKNSTNRAGLFRLRDTNGDDQFDEVKLVGPATRTGGHGRNDLTLGPDGLIYQMHGDSVSVPEGAIRRPSPVTGLNPGDDRAHGHLIRTDFDGTRLEVVAHGLRNPYGIAFNEDGEAFTYDADAEHDMGSPWYRPTRVRHLVSGADYGWRNVTGTWPPYYPDHADEPPNTFDIGKGSPTAVEFGTRSHFPPVYRRALFIMDWTYGRIIAVHLTPQGASYSARGETFLRGRPANVTDFDFGPDGAMYFVTGGRGTQSGLYRVSYTGPKVEEPLPTREQLTNADSGKAARKLRQVLEAFHRPDPRAANAVWPYLNHTDEWIRHAARVALEHQPPAGWQSRALAENDKLRALTAWLALARVGTAEGQARILDRLVGLDLKPLAVTDQLIALRIGEICLQRMDQPDPRLAVALLRQWDALYPHQDTAMNRELSRLLASLGVPGVASRTLALIETATVQTERMHYLFVLRNLQDGWSADERRRYFIELGKMDRFRGGAGLPKFIDQIRNEALAAAPPEEQAALVAVLESVRSPVIAETNDVPRAFVKAWTVAELADLKADQADFARGRAMYHAAQCARCHQVGGEGLAFGPDLTGAAGRFTRRDLLEAIIEPSKVIGESYRNVIVTTRGGEAYTGQVVMEGDYRRPVLKLATDPAQPFKLTEISKADIVSHRESDLSPMPEGLLNSLSREEVLDLLAFLEAGGSPAHPIFQRQAAR